MDALMAEGAWLRRLAAVLVGDSDEAEDLAQETWLVALRAGPRTAAAPRAWLRRVLSSRLRDATRARLRRVAREQAAVDEAASPEDPEALVARMELHQRVAKHMAALEEPIRQVLFLRFVEGLEPVEVARRLGIPGGTARWRLKRGLDELRARLDADFAGERQRWLALLLPPKPRGSAGTAAGPGVAHSPARAQPLRWWGGIGAKLAAGALVLALGAFGASRACAGATPREAKVAAGEVEGSLDTDAAARGATGPVQAPQPTPAAAPAPPRDCPEAEALERERDALSAAAEPFWNPQILFGRSPPNLEAERRLRPLVDEAFTTAVRCGHTFECRGLACRLEVVIPESGAQRSAGMSRCVDLAPKIQLSDRVTTMMKGDDGSAFDPLSRTWLRRQTYYLRLAHESGEPVPRERRPAPQELPAGWNRERGPLPPGLAPE